MALRGEALRKGSRYTNIPLVLARVTVTELGITLDREPFFRYRVKSSRHTPLTNSESFCPGGSVAEFEIQAPIKARFPGQR